MRGHLAILILALPVAACADRLITIPTARKIPMGTYRYELRTQPGSSGIREQFLGLGLGPFFEAEIRSIEGKGSPDIGTFDFAYNYLSPIPDLLPGLSLGVQDALDETVDGRRFYVASTFRPVFSTIGGDVPADITLGIFSGRYTHAFVGVGIPMTKEFRLMAEHNGIRLATGFEYRPKPYIGFRAGFIEDVPRVGLQVSLSF